VTEKGLVIISVPCAPLFCKTLQSYNSPAARARELFKPSTDLASLLVEIEKKFFFGLGTPVGDVTSGYHCKVIAKGVFASIWSPLPRPGRQSIEPCFGSSCFWKLDQNPRL